jgi:hypothetical protein
VDRDQIYLRYKTMSSQDTAPFHRWLDANAGLLSAGLVAMAVAGTMRPRVPMSASINKAPDLPYSETRRARF